MSSNSKIKFKSYMVNSFGYRLNPNFSDDDDNNLSMNFTIKSLIDIKDTGTFVTLEANVGEKEDKACPFIVDVDLTGFFQFETIKIGDVEKIKENIAPNLIAILFPYLRSLISDITTRNNLFPTFTLPVMNIYEMMREEDAIEIIDSRTQ